MFKDKVKALMIVEINTSNTGYGGVLKRKHNSNKIKQIVRFHSSVWIGTQKNYSNIKKEILSIVLCISKFQEYL